MQNHMHECFLAQTTTATYFFVNPMLTQEALSLCLKTAVPVTPPPTTTTPIPFGEQQHLPKEQQGRNRHCGLAS